MKAYLTTDVEHYRDIQTNGFRDCWRKYGIPGIWFASEKLTAEHGYEGPVIISVDIPEDVFEQYENRGDLAHPFREAIIPSAVLNKLNLKIELHQFNA